MLSLCKCQKWKEQVKISKCRKFGDLRLKTVTLVRFLKTKNIPKFQKRMYGSLHGIEAGRAFNAQFSSVQFIVLPVFDL